MAWLRAAAASSIVAFTVSAAPHCFAGGPLGENGSPLQTSDYVIDLFQGPVFAGTRVTGLSGAYVAIAEDVDGDLQNPASPAVRPFYSYSHFDYWLGFGLTFPATLDGVDFFNSGTTTTLRNSPRSFVFFTPALNLQWGEFGLGATLETQQYEITNAAEQGRSVRTLIPTYHIQLAKGFGHNQLVTGVGVRIVSMSVTQRSDTDSSKFESTGAGLELGIVYKPEHTQLRLGVAFRTAIRTQASYSEGLLPDENGDITAVTPTGRSFLPKAVALPWDLNFGFAVQLGDRPLNAPWRTIDELIEREDLLHRVREIDRERARDAALRRARSRTERKATRALFEAEQAADDRELRRIEEAAKRRLETALRAMNQFFVLISGSMLVSGPVDGAVGVESLLSQTVNRSGRRPVVSPRLGVEAGLVPTWLKVRGGTYLEPTRFDTGTERLHGTLGVDVKLTRWNVFGLWPKDYMWRLGLSGDAASRYYTWGLTIGGWYPREATRPGPATPWPQVPWSDD